MNLVELEPIYTNAMKHDEPMTSICGVGDSRQIRLIGKIYIRLHAELFSVVIT